jgi:RecB family exonuclease
VERQFPRYHQQNLFFPDGQRQRLALLGVRLRTTAEQDQEERLLFELAQSRATDQLYLTHPNQDESGAQLLRSFFIPVGQASGLSQPIQAATPPPSWHASPGILKHPDLIPLRSFTPSSLEKYIQCPFLFFADRTLRLQGPPPTPEERIDNLLKGTIIHRTIALWSSSPAAPIGPVFDRVFREICAREGIRLNFRAEALEMELRADLERFARFERERPKPPGFTPGAAESDIAYLLEDGLRITGRIDHHEVSAAGAVVVVDYKYSTEQRLKTICREQEQGLRVQAPLYLLGLEKERGLQPAGMLFCGLRDEPSRHGWLARGLAPDEPELEVLPPPEFRAMLDAAAARTLELVREIRDGHVEVKPRDLGFCREYCLYREVCRISL